MSHRQDTRKKYITLLCAFTIAIAQCPVTLAGGVDSTYDGQQINGGTYYNSPNGKTTFTNSAGTGLHLKAGDLVVGREIKSATDITETGNGGNIHIDAAGQVVRLDGDINVSGVMNGNGGRVTIDSAFLYQNGQIFANGNNAGVVNFNVDSLTMGPNARIEAIGAQAGGNVDIQATGAVDIAQGAVIDTSGQVIGNYNTNVIAIKGGLVNLDGILLANGGVPSSVGGKVTVEAIGDSTALNTDAIAKSGLFDSNETAELVARDNLRNTMDGSIRTGSTSQISVNGANGSDSMAGIGGNPDILPTIGGNGGVIEFKVNDSISANGLLEVNGGHGGNNLLVAIGDVYIKDDGYGGTYKHQDSFGQPGADGGHAGEMTFTYASTMENTGTLKAVGGNGGQGGNAEARQGEGNWATGGNGGNGGNGGTIYTHGGGALDESSNINLDGGIGGNGGLGVSGIQGGCDCENEGQTGAPGNPGKIVQDTEPCDIPPPPPPPCIPPEKPPEDTPPEEEHPEIVPPKNGILQSDKQQPVGQVLYYNRSIFLARPAVPTVKRPSAPAIRYAQVVPSPDAPPMPAPPEVKTPVRGFW